MELCVHQSTAAYARLIRAGGHVDIACQRPPTDSRAAQLMHPPMQLRPPGTRRSERRPLPLPPLLPLQRAAELKTVQRKFKGMQQIEAAGNTPQPAKAAGAAPSASRVGGAGGGGSGSVVV